MKKVVHWQHPEKIAEGWLAIDTLINGVCGGGVFMHSQATMQEIVELARDMTYKNKLNAIPFGGAKAGIRFDPTNPEAKNILNDFLLFCRPYLQSQWSTGADLNTDSDTIDAIVKSMGIDSSFFALGQSYAVKQNIPNQSSQLRARVSLPLNRYFTLEQGIVGYSLVEIIKQLAIQKPLRLVLQGFGKIGSSFAYFTEQKQLATVVGVCDISGALMAEAGLSIKQLLAIRSKNPGCYTLAQLHPIYAKDFPCQWLPNEEARDNNLLTLLKTTRADVVSFCANRYAVTPEVLEYLIQYTYSASKERFLISGANLPFSKPHLAAIACSNNIVCLPSWFSSAGNSLLYAEALSVDSIALNWPSTIIEKITRDLTSIINTCLKKSNKQTKDLYHHLNVSYCQAQPASVKQAAFA